MSVFIIIWYWNFDEFKNNIQIDKLTEQISNKNKTTATTNFTLIYNYLVYRMLNWNDVEEGKLGKIMTIEHAGKFVGHMFDHFASRSNNMATRFNRHVEWQHGVLKCGG